MCLLYLTFLRTLILQFLFQIRRRLILALILLLFTYGDGYFLSRFILLVENVSIFSSIHVQDIFMGLVGLIVYQDLQKELCDVHLISFIILGYVLLFTVFSQSPPYLFDQLKFLRCFQTKNLTFPQNWLLPYGIQFLCR